MMAFKQTQGYRISFELTKLNQSNQALVGYHDTVHPLSLSIQALILSLGVISEANSQSDAVEQ